MDRKRGIERGRYRARKRMKREKERSSSMILLWSQAAPLLWLDFFSPPVVRTKPDTQKLEQFVCKKFAKIG